MKKVLIAYDGINFPKGAFEFARQLNRLSPILLTGIFLPQINYASLWSYANAMSGPAMIPLIEEDQAEEINKNIARFKSMCQCNDIAFRVHKKYYGLSIAEIPKETRFSDLLLLGGEKFKNSLIESEHTNYIADVLKNTECPVLVVPENYKASTINVLGYDGSSSSVFAIKQFAYLFPELCQKETLLVYMNGNGNTKLPNQDYIMEYASQHFGDLTFETLEMSHHKRLLHWLDERQNALLVCGACGRSFLSEMAKESFVQPLLESHQQLLFIAHK